ncbi:MAG TPA: hypothetical protein VJ732_18790, partial [Bryobacteraceae bacterium]|nr:hypothetical protein [Bryobacteraceae bacterium]
MRSQERCAVPRASRWLIGAAALLVPPGPRKAWKREWLAEIWHGHATILRQGDSPTGAWRRVTKFALGAFVDAADLRMEGMRGKVNRRSLARHPAFCIGSLLILLLAMGGWTGGFRHCRGALASAYPEAEQLVLLSRPLGLLGIEAPANPEQVSTWVESSKWFGEVAGFALRGDTLEVTPNFFSVLHVPPSAHFRFLGHAVRTITAADPKDFHGRFSGAVARLKNPRDRAAAEAHFARFSILDGAHVSATFVEQRSRWPFYFAGTASLLFLAAGMIRSRRPARNLGFFALKTGLLLGTMAMCWAEVA